MKNDVTHDKQMGLATLGGILEGVGMATCFGDHILVGAALVVLGLIFVFLSNHIA